MANEIKALTIDGTRRTIKDETARNAAQQAQTTANSKQDELTFDTAPTSGSNNPVTSGGVYTAMQSFAPELPIASEDTLGGVKVDGTTITADENGVISGASTYVLPTASTTQLGGVKIDGDTVNIDANGVISTSPSAQADWDETDSADPAYIANKPFGYVPGDVTVIEQATYGGSAVTYEGKIQSTRYAAVDKVTATEDITNNTEYKITVDGTAYTVTSRNVSSTFANSDDTRLLNITGYGIVTPYCAIVRSTYEQSLGSIFVLLATNGQWTTVPSRTVKLEKDGEVIMQIDPDFLPAATSSDYGVVKVDSAISSSSANPVQNHAIKQAMDDLQSAISELSSGTTLPVMSASNKGGAKLGSGLSVDGEELNLGPLTESGSGASVQTDGCGIFGVTGEGFAHQDGTPTPDSPQEIRVARGRNLLSESNLEYGGISATNGNNVTGSFVRTAGKIPIEPDKSYVFSSGYESTQILICWYDSNESFIKSDPSNLDVKIYSFSRIAPANARYMRFQIRPNGGYGAAITVAEITHPQLELGSTPSPYVPYGHIGLDITANGQTTTTPIPLPSKGFAGALPDGMADVLTLDSAGRWEWECVSDFIDLGTKSWIKGNSLNSGDGNVFYVTDNSLPLTRYTYCEIATVISQTISWENLALNSMTLPGGYIVVGADSSYTAQTFKAAVDGKRLLFLLATPSYEHGYIDLPELPAGATVSCPELSRAGITVLWFIEGARELVEHAKNWYRRSKSGDEEIEDAIAELATRVAQLENA